MPVEPRSSPLAGIPTAAIVLVGILAVVVIAGFIALTLAGRETGQYALFIAGPLVTTIVGAVLAQRVSKVEEVARTVEHQTNGQLTNQFVEVHEHLDGQTGILLAGLEPNPAPAVPARYKPSSSGSDPGALPKQGSPRPDPDQAVRL